MTFTPAVVNDARQRLVLVTGKTKAKVIADWLHGETAAPIGRIRQLNTVVVLDKAAASQLPT